MMPAIHRVTAIAVASAFALSLSAATDTALAQKKGAQDKRSACIAKARAENPDRAAGHARNAAFNRCMGR
jgi:uncharacterized membrane protein